MNQWLSEQNAQGAILEAPAAASTGYLESRSFTHVPKVPPLTIVLDLADAAADMVASAEGLSSEQAEAEASVFVESSAPAGMPTRSEARSEEETDFKVSKDLETDSKIRADDDEYEDDSGTAWTDDPLHSRHTRRVKTVLMDKSR